MRGLLCLLLSSIVVLQAALGLDARNDPLVSLLLAKKMNTSSN